jgi:hypothetical protein
LIGAVLELTQPAAGAISMIHCNREAIQFLTSRVQIWDDLDKAESQKKTSSPKREANHPSNFDV